MRIEKILPGVIANMTREEVDVLSTLIEKVRISWGHSRIMEAWKKRCQQLGISSGSVPEILERKKRKEVRQRRAWQFGSDLFFL